MIYCTKQIKGHYLSENYVVITPIFDDRTVIQESIYDNGKSIISNKTLFIKHSNHSKNVIPTDNLIHYSSKNISDSLKSETHLLNL